MLQMWINWPWAEWAQALSVDWCHSLTDLPWWSWVAESIERVLEDAS